MRGDVDAFAAGAPQFDDITMLCLKYHGAEGRKEKPAGGTDRGAGKEPMTTEKEG